MIKTSRQLKDKIKNMSGGDSDKAQTLIRNYMMERFLERISVSPFRDNFVIKGGMLVAALVGLDFRATMDIDASVRSLPLTITQAKSVIENIASMPFEDGVDFNLKNAVNIMEENEYPGIRFMIEAKLENLKQTIKLDISTGDVITPRAVMYSYKLMFENRSIPLYTYNIETLLAEKLETVVSRGEANTRMRDFYDIHMIMEQERKNICVDDLQKAFEATCRHRETENTGDLNDIIYALQQSAAMKRQWENYKNSSFYVGDLLWEDVTESTSELLNLVLNEQQMREEITGEMEMTML